MSNGALSCSGANSEAFALFEQATGNIANKTRSSRRHENTNRDPQESSFEYMHVAVSIALASAMSTPMALYGRFITFYLFMALFLWGL